MLRLLHFSKTICYTVLDSRIIKKFNIQNSIPSIVDSLYPRGSFDLILYYLKTLPHKFKLLLVRRVFQNNQIYFILKISTPSAQLLPHSTRGSFDLILRYLKRLPPKLSLYSQFVFKQIQVLRCIFMYKFDPFHIVTPSIPQRIKI